MSLIRLILNSNGTAADFKSQCPLAVGGHDAINNFNSYVAGVNAGELASADFDFNVGAVQATATIVSAATAVAAETMSLLNVTLTAVAADPAANEFVVSATPATQAANIAACINASASFAGKCSAAVTSGGTVTVTAVVPGLLGNGLQISESLTGVTVTQFANGSDGTAYSIDLR
jgi:hypothetical protein